MLVFSRFCITPYQHTCFYDILYVLVCFFFFFQAEDGIRDIGVTGVQTCALPISTAAPAPRRCRTAPAGRRARARAPAPPGSGPARPDRSAAGCTPRWPAPAA